MNAKKIFFDTNTLLYLLSSDTKKADWVTKNLQQSNVISVQVLNEFTSASIRKIKISNSELDEFLDLFTSTFNVRSLDIATFETHNISLGEGGIVDAYDEDGITNSLITKADHFDFRRTAFADIYSVDGDIAFKMQLNKINSFTSDVLAQKHASTLPQKCGMDQDDVLAVDLHGNVLTCQNVSAVEISKNGESHLGGTLDDFENVAITTSTHWSNREECPKCPVLHLCKGACMFLDNKFWKISCANAYSDNVALFALSFEKMTGYIPILIKNDDLPLERQDIFGTLFEHKEESIRKVIPIKIVNHIAEVVDNVPIYSKSEVAYDNPR